MGETVEICGINVEVVSAEECEEATVVVCMCKGFQSPFSDDVEATCSMCESAVIHRPHAPVKPPKICFECALQTMEATRQ